MPSSVAPHSCCVLQNIRPLPEQVGETFCIQSNDHIAVPVEAMVDVSNVPSSLRKAVSAVLDNPDMAQRIAGELAMAGVSADELEILLDRAMGRDAWTNLARHALRDGLPSGLATLALNLWGFAGFAGLTGDTAAAAALYGASLGSAIVVLDEVFQHMFEGMTYTPVDLAKAIPVAPYLAATTLPLTLRNLVRAFTHVCLVLAGKPQLVADVDNGVEVIGGLFATIATGHAMERLSLPGTRARRGGILMREDLGSTIGLLRDGRAVHASRVARQAGWAAICAVQDIPSGVRRLATPVGVVTVATLAAFVPTALAAMAATQDAVRDDTPAVPEAAAELVRTGVLFSAYLLLAGASRYAEPVFSRVGTALRYVGGACLTSASRMTSSYFTGYPGWYGPGSGRGR